MSEHPIEGLQAVFLANRDTLLRFLRARGAGEEAEDVLQEVWLKIVHARTGPIAAPMSYLYRTANSVMIDRYRSQKQAHLREKEWSDANSGTLRGVSDAPPADRIIAGKQLAQQVEAALQQLPARATDIFRRCRIDGLTQREVAREIGVSVSTVENDLRSVYRVLAALRERLDEE